MAEKKTRLHHIWTEPLEKFLARIDEFGGWPVNAKFVTMAHSDERECEFTDRNMRTEWWTTICSADDYYRWKLSPEMMKEIESEIRRKISSQILSQ